MTQVLIFPTTAVCNSFYRELRNPRFPNRYADYLERGDFRDAKKALELTGILRNGTDIHAHIHMHVRMCVHICTCTTPRRPSS